MKSVHQVEFGLYFILDFQPLCAFPPLLFILEATPFAVTSLSNDPLSTPAIKAIFDALMLVFSDCLTLNTSAI